MLTCIISVRLGRSLLYMMILLALHLLFPRIERTLNIAASSDTMLVCIISVWLGRTQNKSFALDSLLSMMILLALHLEFPRIERMLDIAASSDALLVCIIFVGPGRTE